MLDEQRAVTEGAIGVCTPVRTEVVFQCAEHGDEDLDCLFGVREFSGAGWRWSAVVGVVRGGEELAGQVAD